MSEENKNIINSTNQFAQEQVSVESVENHVLMSEIQQFLKLGGWKYDIESGRMTWTDEVYDIYGVSKDYDPNDVEQNMSFYSQEDLLLLSNSFEKAINQGIPYDLEVRFNRLDGVKIWVRTTGNPTVMNGKHVNVSGFIMDITERKITELAHKVSEEKYHKLFSEMLGGSALNEIIFDEAGVPVDYMTLDVNKAFEEIIGVNRKDIIGNKASQSLPKEELKSWLELFIPVAMEGKKINYEQYSAINNKYFQGSAYSPKYGQFAVTFYDVTDKKLADLQLSESENKYRNLFENMAQGAFYQRADGVLADVNQAALDMLGLTRDEFLGRTSNHNAWLVVDEEINELKPEDHTSMMVLKTGKQVLNKTIGIYNYHKNSFVWATTNGYPLYKAGEDKPYQVFVTMHDLTEQKKAEENTNLNQERLEKLLYLTQMKNFSIQNIFDYALEVSISLTKSKVGYIYYYSEENRQFTLFSWSNEAMKECSIVEKQTIYDLDKTGIWGEAVRQRKPIIVNDFQASNDLKKGYPEGHVHLDKFLTIPVIVDNQIVAVFGVGNKLEDYNELDILQLNLMSDSLWKIVKMKEDEEKLKKLANELSELNASKDKFFSILAHDLKSPFSGLMGLADLLAQEIDNMGKKDVKELLDAMNQTTKNLFNLIENLLSWSRSQINKLDFNPVPFVINDIIKNNIEIQKIISDKKKISVTSFIPKEYKVIADENMVNTVLRNLISNAIKFSYEGSFIDILAEAVEDNFLKITITDYGVGIDEERLAKLFRIDSLSVTHGTADEKGTGLGLIVCKEFVEKHGGVLSVDSSEGLGSKFSFTLPLSK